MAAHRVTERRQQAGFTMIEVMVAMLLTALTVIGVMGLYRIESRASGFSRRETEAAVLAQDKLEELRGLAAPSGPVAATVDNPVDQFSTTGDHIFTRTYTIDTTADPKVFKITVTVEWNEDGIPRSVTVWGQRGST